MKISFLVGLIVLVVISGCIQSDQLQQAELEICEYPEMINKANKVVVQDLSQLNIIGSKALYPDNKELFDGIKVIQATYEQKTAITFTSTSTEFKSKEFALQAFELKTSDKINDIVAQSGIEDFTSKNCSQNKINGKCSYGEYQGFALMKFKWLENKTIKSVEIRNLHSGLSEEEKNAFINPFIENFNGCSMKIGQELIQSSKNICNTPTNIGEYSFFGKQKIAPSNSPTSEIVSTTEVFYNFSKDDVFRQAKISFYKLKSKEMQEEAFAQILTEPCKILEIQGQCQVNEWSDSNPFGNIYFRWGEEENVKTIFISLTKTQGEVSEFPQLTIIEPFVSKFKECEIV